MDRSELETALAPAATRAKIDGHRLSEFVYGIVTGMVVIAAIGTSPEKGWVGTAAIGLGLWGVRDWRESGYLGVLLLLLVGLQAGSLTKETWPRRLLIALVYASLGILVVAIEYIVHH